MHEVHNRKLIRTQLLCRLSKIRQAPKKYGFLMDKDGLIIDYDHTSYMEAMLNIDSKEWLETIKS